MAMMKMVKSCKVGAVWALVIFMGVTVTGCGKSQSDEAGQPLSVTAPHIRKQEANARKAVMEMIPYIASQCRERKIIKFGSDSFTKRLRLDEFERDCELAESQLGEFETLISVVGDVKEGKNRSLVGEYDVRVRYRHGRLKLHLEMKDEMGQWRLNEYTQDIRSRLDAPLYDVNQDPRLRPEWRTSKGDKLIHPELRPDESEDEGFSGSDNDEPTSPLEDPLLF